MYKLKGFTLIELLVVIAVIALLLAILMPALRKARGQAQMAACSAQLTQVRQIKIFLAIFKKNIIDANQSAVILGTISS